MLMLTATIKSLMSTMMEMARLEESPGEELRIPFKNLFGYALVQDETGREMHKSDGTAIWFEEAAEQIGVDTMRWMYCAQSPIQNLRFGTRHPAQMAERVLRNRAWPARRSRQAVRGPDDQD